MAKNKDNRMKSSNKSTTSSSSKNTSGGSMKNTNTQIPDNRPARSGPGGE